MVERFSQRCREAIGDYVYALLDPRIEGSVVEKIFYVGKGSGDRCYDHARADLSIEEVADHQLKLATIRAIRDTGHGKPPVVVIAHDLTPQDAYRLEAILIATLQSPALTNAVRGKGDRDYWLSADELDGRYAEPILRSSVPGTLLLVSLNGGKNLPSYRLIKDDPAVLKKRTLGAWPISEKKARTVDYVVGVYRGLSRCAFKVLKDGDNAVFSARKPTEARARTRVRFEGEIVSDWPWLLKSFVDENGRPLTRFDPQSACRFLDAV